VAALRSEQVSRVVALWFVSPVLVAVLAAVFLGESLPMASWMAVVTAALGAVAVSWTGGSGGGGFVRPRTAAYALVAALTWAVANTLVKHVVSGEDFWQLYISSRVGFSLTLMLLALVPTIRSEARRVKLSSGLVGFILLAELVVTGGLIASFGAINLGPVSLVSALGAPQPLLVLLYSLGLAALAPRRFRGWVTRGNLRVQVIGTVALVAGVFTITLR
jgi:drug/metabolite transporter (DMT)-like permease